MDGLRWLLLIAGVLVIAGVYLYSRREAARPEQPDNTARREPSLDGGTIESPAEDNFDPYDSQVLDEPSLADEPPEPEVEKVTEKIVTLRLVAGKHGAFAGDELAIAMRRVGMRHGKFGIFHRYVGDDENKIVFSAASLVEPGSFDLANLKDQKLPGISLFLVLPGPAEGAEAFDIMMTAARSLAQTMDGELLDETGSTLSIQRERYMREEIIQYQHGIKVA